MTAKQKLRAELRDKKQSNITITIPKSELKNLVVLPKFICKHCGTHNNLGYNFKTKYLCDSCDTLIKHYKYTKTPMTIIGLYCEWRPKVVCKCCGGTEAIVTGMVCDVCLGRQIKLADGYLKWSHADQSISVEILGVRYDTIAQASRILNISYSSIYRAALGYQNTSNGSIVTVIPRPLTIQYIENYRPTGSFKEYNEQSQRLSS